MTVFAILGWSFISLILFFRPLAGKLHLWQTGLNVTILSLGTSLVLIWMQKRLENGSQFKGKYLGLVRFLGRNSYEIYLTHMFVVFILFKIYREQEFSGEWAWALYVATILLSALLGEIVARFFSNPVNRYLRMQFKVRNELDLSNRPLRKIN